MRHYADEGYLHARIYAMRGRLLSLKDYTSLVRDPDERFSKVSGAHGTIEAKETLFGEQMAGVIHLAEATRKYAPLFLAFLRQYEASNIKLIAAKAFGRQSLEQWYDIGPYAVLERSLLEKSLTLQDIRAILSGTYLDGVFEDSSSYERIEISLDIFTLRNLSASSGPFLPEDKKVFQDFMSRRLSVITAVWHQRLKESYFWSDERIRLYLESFHDLFGVPVRSQAKIAQEALKGPLEYPRKSDGQMASPADSEHDLDQYYYHWVSSMFHRDFMSVYCVLAYLWLLFYQVRNLFRIIDGMRFGLPPDAILERIIGEE